MTNIRLRNAVVVLVALAAPLVSAAMIDLPKRKSGLWDMTMSREGGTPGPQPGKMQMCIDEKVDDLTKQIGQSAAREMCSKTDFRREGDRIVSDSICKFNQSTVTTHMVLTGKFDSEYQADMQTRFDPPMMGMAQSHTVIKGRWVGPCKPGQRPGDMVLPNGMTINVLDAEKGAPIKK